MAYSVVIIIWLVLLVLAYPYVHRARHPAIKPMAAYLLFVSLFSAVGGGIFLVLFWIILATGAAAHLNNPVWSLLFVAIVILPAFFIARWQLKRPPWGQSVPK